MFHQNAASSVSVNHLLFLLLFIASSSKFVVVVEAVTCQYGLTCLPYAQYQPIKVPTFEITTKECDVCSYFQCVIDGNKVVSGYGCLDDFYQLCPNAPLAEENQLRRTSHNWYYNISISVSSCGWENCAALMWEKDYDYFGLQIDALFGKDVVQKDYNETCSVSSTIAPSTLAPSTHESSTTTTSTSTKYQRPDKVKCQYGATCEPFAQYERGKVPPLENITKECDVCSYFQCVLDGNKVISGYGCLDDFYQLCPNAPLAEENQLRRTSHNWYYNISISVSSCGWENCAALMWEKDNGTFGLNIDALFDKDVVDKDYNETCIVPPTFAPSTSAPHPIPLRTVPPRTNAPPSSRKLKCGVANRCYEEMYFGFGVPKDIATSHKSCDACVYYQCKLGNGYGKLGFGCFEDFVSDCNLDSKVIQTIQSGMNKDAKYQYGDNKVVFHSCKDSDNCAERDTPQVTVNNNYDSHNGGEPYDPFQPECPAAAAHTGNNQSKGISMVDMKLQEMMMVFALIYIVFL